ncbi:hypothetical protein AR438_15965 [Chryseobacterium aquaticum]|uniref:Uncharacterized protein n=1 Tax=Chryseobacterium aquaticum TaxID=452084 RepID=A0A0Q3P3W0_9FLAO|nr:hypothetical protein [Chryseobacterium aquaticum]KQK24678.1 hypothetical protein AR438_15965 [Chryseobacterium aquaticum]
MKSEKWLETKKEAEIDSDGKIVIKKITLERQKGFERREIIDYAIKIIGVFAIGIPLILFYFNQKLEKEKQIRSKQLEVYSSTMTDLHKFSYINPFVQNYENEASKVLNEVYPKVLILNDKNVIKEFENLNEYIEFSIQNNSFFLKCDKINIAIIRYLPQKKYPEKNDDFNYLEYQKINLNDFKKSKNPLIIKQLDRIDIVIDSLQNRLNHLDNKKIENSLTPDRGPYFYKREFMNEYQDYTKEQIIKISNEIKNSLNLN